MELETLKIGNELQNKIKGLKESLECFEETHEFPKGKSNTVSLNPEIIIEYDYFDPDHTRCTHKIPMKLNNEFIILLKDKIKSELEKTKKQFKELK